MPGTGERILDAAERLFAAQGFAGTSLRAVTQAAGVNLAAVHYHFGSKDALLQAVLDRVVRPVTRERMDLLALAEAAADAAPPTVEAILAAYLAPGFRFLRDPSEHGVIVSRLLGRSFTEPAEAVQPLVREQFEDVALQFVAVLGRALPHVPEAELYWRFKLVVAVQTYVLADAGGFAGLPGTEDHQDVDAAVDRLIAFLAPALRAPPPAASPTGASPSEDARR